MGLAAVITIDGFAWGIAGELSSTSFLGPNGGAEVLHDLQESEWAYATTSRRSASSSEC